MIHQCLADGLVVPNPYEAGTVPWDREAGEHVEFRTLPDQATIRLYSVAGDLLRVIEHCRSEEAGGHTPSDFPLARLDQATLDLVLAGARDVEDVYPLPPMQQGLLFHTLLDPGVGVYVEQLRLDLQGEMNGAAWRRAWEHVVERHPILRTRFAWKGLREPRQIVLPAVALPWEEEDWTGLGEDERQGRLATLLEEDHRAGFDLERAPLLRHTDTHR